MGREDEGAQGKVGAQIVHSFSFGFLVRMLAQRGRGKSCYLKPYWQAVISGDFFI